MYAVYCSESFECRPYEIVHPTHSNFKYDSKNSERDLCKDLLCWQSNVPWRFHLGLCMELWVIAWEFPVGHHLDSKIDIPECLCRQFIRRFISTVHDVVCNFVGIDWNTLFKSVFNRNVDLPEDKLAIETYSSGRKFSQVRQVGHRNYAPIIAILVLCGSFITWGYL